MSTTIPVMSLFLTQAALVPERAFIKCLEIPPVCLKLFFSFIIKIQCPKLLFIFYGFALINGQLIVDVFVCIVLAFLRSKQIDCEVI